MPKASQLASIGTEALVDELKRRFAAIEKAKAELFGSSTVSGAGTTAKVRARGGTSEYARAKSSLIQKIRHAHDRKDDPKKITAMKKELATLDARYKKAK